MRTDQGLAGKTFQTGDSYVVGDAHEDEESDPAKAVYRSGLSVPIGDRGVFQAVRTERDALDEDDVELAELLVRHTARGLERIENKRELERQNERLEAFAKLVSHDLRNPLHVASGNLDLVREDVDDGRLEDAARALDRMEALIDDLLSLARQGETVSEFERVDLASLVTRCWATVQTVDATLETRTDATIRADPQRLQQLVENLLDNAVEHGGSDVTITVGTLDEERGFYVEDDGPGIPPEDREAVFEMGYSTADDGTGFGLEIVSEIADAHGWEVSVEEGEAGGARFEVTDVEFASEE